MSSLRGLVVLLLGLVSFSAVADMASAADVTFPHTQHWDTFSSWSGPFWGGASLDSSTSAPGSASKSLKFTFPEGYPGGGNPDVLSVTFSNPTTELWLQYYFKYSIGWTRHQVNDKQTYIQINASGEPDIIIGGGPWGAQQINVAVETGLNEKWLISNTGYNPNIYTGAWFKVTLRAVLNTPGVANGIVQVWINDGLVINRSDVIMLESGYSGKWARIDYAPVWGGTGGTKPKTEYFWVDYTVISTDPIGSLSLPPASGAMIPQPPSNIAIQ